MWVQETRALFVIAIMQPFTGAAHFRYEFVDDDAGEACQHGNTEQMKKHRETLSGDFPFKNATVST